MLENLSFFYPHLYYKTQHEGQLDGKNLSIRRISSVKTRVKNTFLNKKVFKTHKFMGFYLVPGVRESDHYLTRNLPWSKSGQFH